MANDAADDENTVKLTPEAPAGGPKLAVIKPGPRAVTVNVPTAKPVAQKKQSEDEMSDTSDTNTDVIKKGDLLDQIVETTGVKRSDAKSVMEALFDQLGQHFAAGASLQLPPLGKVKVVNSKEVGEGATSFTIKVRTPNPD